MALQRTLGRVRTLSPPAIGQFGPDHRVIPVITQAEWTDADPFILLMDDRIDGHFVGGAHPHTGMETVTFLVSGSLGQESGEGHLGPGDVEWTTTGKGVIHGGRIGKGTLHFRNLQLWVTLPKQARWAEPDHQFVPKGEALVRQEGGARLTLYSGTSGNLHSPTRNHVPVTVAAIELEPGAVITQDAPTTHNGFLYPLEGRVHAGGIPLGVGQVGWLDRPGANDPNAVLEISNVGPLPARLLFFAGERQNIPLVTYGPFVGDTQDDLRRAFREYQAGSFREY